MLLEKLVISSKNEIIRDIPFKLQGLNLVIDNAPIIENSTVSGNSVGKTTFIRSVDFCFGSDGKDIYVDKENKTDNEDVKNFLIENEVSFSLSILNRHCERFVLKRSFNSKNDLFINDIKYENLKLYKQKLLNLLFHIPENDSKISFREIIKKFIRSDSFSENNIYKILHTLKKDSVYEAIYLLLFGFPDQDVISKRLEILNKIDSLKNELKKISGKSNLPRLQSRLSQQQGLIDDIEIQIKSFDLPKTYEVLIDKLKTLKSKTAELSSNIGNLNTKISLSKKTRNELIHRESKIDPNAINKLYEEAQLLLGPLQKPFEEVLFFHNKMVSNKLKFVEQHILKLEHDRILLKQQLETHLKEQSHILKLLDDTGTFDDLIKIREELNSHYIEKGKLVQQIELIQKLYSDIESKTTEFSEINLIFETYIDELNKNIVEIFNKKYFTEFTKRTHGEKLFIYYDNENRKFAFDNLGGNPGDGYKKTEIITFDLAFISYFNELGLDFPLFFLHDKFEIVHPNQVQSIFDIADSINGQLFISVLRNSVSFLGEEYIESKKILELSQDSKFFKIP
jgi:uncharacterized protein YydD (DUF2326 family)